jgi:hypothetical protein
MYTSIKTLSILLISSLIVIACGSKTPNCSADESKKLLTQLLAEKLKELGLPAQNIENLITISDVQVVKQDDKLDKYLCKANFSITKPSGLADKIYKIQTNSDKGLEAFQDLFVKKYGNMQGMILTAQLNQMIISGLSSEGLALSENDAENSKKMQLRLKTFLNDLTSPEAIEVSYEVSRVENNGKFTPYISWKIQEADLLTVNVILFQINDALN